ncbi:hypothetical protein AB0C44_22335 [Micromonospora taraxaci]|uniref:hypothetical protein n=1 Tax=Micromonospora taraxaci TaxID=1316803 RepID=UPI0033D1B6DA
MSRRCQDVRIATTEEPAAPGTHVPTDAEPFIGQGPHPPVKPWWHRLVLIVSLVAGGLAGLAFVLATPFLSLIALSAFQGDRMLVEPRPELGALVVAGPADSTPAVPVAANDTVDFDRLLPGADTQHLLLTPQVRADLRHAAGVAWTQPDNTAVTVTLLEFASKEVAVEFSRSYIELQLASHDTVTIGGDGPAMAFLEAEASAISGVEIADEVLIFVRADSPADRLPDTVVAVESLLREQRDRL